MQVSIAINSDFVMVAMTEFSGYSYILLAEAVANKRKREIPIEFIAMILFAEHFSKYSCFNTNPAFITILHFFVEVIICNLTEQIFFLKGLREIYKVYSNTEKHFALINSMVMTYLRLNDHTFSSKERLRKIISKLTKTRILY